MNSTLMMPGALSIVLDERFHNETARLAFSLAGRFGERGSHVGLWGENSRDYLTALFALLRAGLVAVPLPTRLSARELADVVRSADLRGILTTRDFPPALKCVSSDVPVQPLAEESEAAPLRGRVGEWREEDAAVLMCSSGSAGRVKMIPLTRRTLLDHARAVCEHLHVTSRDSWLACLPFYHVGGLAIAFRCLASGAALITAESNDTDGINRILDSGEASVVSVVPTMLERMLAAREGKPYSQSVRAIIVGGGPVPMELLKRCPQAYATYGLTEAGSMVTCARPGCGEDERRTCGPPIPGTQIQILNEAGEKVKRGETGEIAVQGVGAAETYWQDSEAAAGTFRDGWIHTGDVGRLDGNDFLIVEARRTDLIVSGGENIYPAEIEAALREHPRIVEAVVLPVEDAEWGQTPAALVVLSPGGILKRSELSDFLSERLARYKFPRKIVIVKKIPRLGNGKPDLREVRRLLTEGEDAPE